MSLWCDMLFRGHPRINTAQAKTNSSNCLLAVAEYAIMSQPHCEPTNGSTTWYSVRVNRAHGPLSIVCKSFDALK